MDAMKEAFKRKLMEMKGGAGGPQNGGPGMLNAVAGDDQKNQGSDLAPNVEGEPEGDAVHLLPNGKLDELSPEILDQILAALADHDPGAGRGPSGLQERAAIGAKQKLQGMKK